VIKAHSSVLTSHLVTPGPSHRSIDHSAVRALHETKEGKVAPHSVSITPRKVDMPNPNTSLALDMANSSTSRALAQALTVTLTVTLTLLQVDMAERGPLTEQVT
jgi:hypothetical protein